MYTKPAPNPLIVFFEWEQVFLYIFCMYMLHIYVHIIQSGFKYEAYTSKICTKKPAPTLKTRFRDWEQVFCTYFVCICFIFMFSYSSTQLMTHAQYDNIVSVINDVHTQQAFLRV